MIAINLKETREKKGISQNQLAQEIGHTANSIQRIEKGRFKSIPTATLDKLCKALQCKTGDLLLFIPD
ncbi:MAG: helix-turn-helix domain-containing protein [Sphaerospermopsis kisseleviana]